MTRKSRIKINSNNELKKDDIRLIKSKDDWKQFVEMTRENFPKFIEKVIEEGIEYHQQEGRYLFGFFKNKKLLGNVGIKVVPSRKLGIIGYLQVKKDSRKKGIANELYKEIIKISNKKACKFLYLAVYAKNKQVISIYKHWGFREVPMIYNITEIAIKEHNLEIQKFKTRKTRIRTEKSLEKIIKQMYTEYNLLNEVYQYFELMYECYSKNDIYIRKLYGKTHLIVISANKDNNPKN